MAEIILLAVSVSLDAFSVSVVQGSLYHSFFFALFQMIMPLIGWIAGLQFKNLITGIDHWIAFILLSAVGLRMMIKSKPTIKVSHIRKINFRQILALAIATSIDALVIGITFAFIDVPIVIAIILFGMVTFIMSTIGAHLSKRLKNTVGKKMEIIGGIILILIGLKILLEHLLF